MAADGAPDQRPGSPGGEQHRQHHAALPAPAPPRDRKSVSKRQQRPLGGRQAKRLPPSEAQAGMVHHFARKGCWRCGSRSAEPLARAMLDFLPVPVVLHGGRAGVVIVEQRCPAGVHQGDPAVQGQGGEQGGVVLGGFQARRPRVSASMDRESASCRCSRRVRPEYADTPVSSTMQRARSGREQLKKDFLAHLILHTDSPRRARFASSAAPGTQLLAQGTHMHVHRAGLPGEVDAPHRIQQRVPGA